MRRTNPARQAGRYASTKDRLYEAAAALFVERGYEDTTMADIAERAGTARRTAFNHFASKGDIPMLWTRRMADRAWEAITASAEEETSERIKAFFRQISHEVTAKPELSRQMMLGWTAATGPIRYESQLLADLTPLLRDGQAHGQIDQMVDVAVVARTLSDVYMGVIYRWVRDQGTSGTLQSMAEGGINLILSAIRPQPKSQSEGVGCGVEAGPTSTTSLADLRATADRPEKSTRRE